MAVATQTMTMAHTALASSGSISTGRPLKRSSSSSFDLDLPLRASKAPRLQPPPPTSQQRLAKPMPLRRQPTSLDLSSLASPASSPPSPAPKRQRVAPQPSAPPKQQFPARHTPRKVPVNHPSTAAVSSAVWISPAARTSSPLSPVRSYLPARPIFPRSKNVVSLYRKALTNLGSTADKCVAVTLHQNIGDDVVMSDRSQKATWVVVPETEDWDEDWDMEEVCRL